MVSLVAKPEEGYRFVEWMGDVETVADVHAATTTMLAGDFSVTAVFRPIAQYELTISSTIGGSVSAPGEGTLIYCEGTSIDLVATPTKGYRFGGWTGDVATIADPDAAATAILMGGNYSIAANFIRTCDLTVSSTDGGSVTAPGEGSFVYDVDTVVELVAEAEGGYRFIGWTGRDPLGPHGTVCPGVHGVDIADDPAPYPLAYLTDSLAGMSLIAHLRRHLVFPCRFGQKPRF